jgi:glycerol kinase
MGTEVVLSGIAGDQQAALFGQGCFDVGESKTTYGTGCFLLSNTGDEPVFSKNGLLTTAAANLSGEKFQYALEGSVFVGGAVIGWIRDELRFIVESADSEYFAKKVMDNGGVYVVPAFSGLGTPYWDMSARGTILGLTRGSGRNHIIRAALESIAYQTDDVLKAIESDFGKAVSDLKVDGGASNNDFLMQFQADISNLRVLKPQNSESTALGAAFLAGLSTGFFENREELRRKLAISKTFEPCMENEQREMLLSGWKRAVKATQAF